MLFVVRVRFAKHQFFDSHRLHPACAVAFQKLRELALVCQFLWHLDLVAVVHQVVDQHLPITFLGPLRHEVKLLHAGPLEQARVL